MKKEKQKKYKFPRSIVQQKPKIESNKKYYKRDRNKKWKNEEY